MYLAIISRFKNRCVAGRILEVGEIRANCSGKKGPDINATGVSGMECCLTLRPASLLWRFISWRALSRVPGISLDSRSRMSIKF